MDKIGLLSDIAISADDIYQGRKWLDTDGQEHDGRLSYHRGLASAMEIFRHVQSLTDTDLELVLLTEYTFIAQELQLCDPADTSAVSSLQNAMQSIDDAFTSLKAVADAKLYEGANMTHPNSSKYRIKGMPRDAFHIMCIAHRARINNILRSPGINLTEKELLRHRLENITAAQAAYLKRQQGILEATNNSCYISTLKTQKANKKQENQISPRSGHNYSEF